MRSSAYLLRSFIHLSRFDPLGEKKHNDRDTVCTVTRVEIFWDRLIDRPVNGRSIGQPCPRVKNFEKSALNFFGISHILTLERNDEKEREREREPVEP